MGGGSTVRGTSGRQVHCRSFHCILVAQVQQHTPCVFGASARYFDIYKILLHSLISFAYFSHLCGHFVCVQKTFHFVKHILRLHLKLCDAFATVEILLYL